MFDDNVPFNPAFDNDLWRNFFLKNKKINKNSNHYKWIICPSLPHFNAVVVENSLQCDDNDNLFNAHELDSKQPFNNNNNNNK